MANRYMDQFLYSFIKKPTVISGVISLSSAGAVVAASTSIPGAASIAKTATGVYTITLRDKWCSLKAVHSNIAETAQDLDAKPGACDVTSAKTIVINTKTAGVNTDASATCKIYVSIFLSNSSVVSKG
jgi:hypothetical protein